MNVPVLNISGAQVSSIDLPADIFEYDVNVDLMHQYVVMQGANARLGTHKTLRRGEINRTKAKWYRQKGTGRARHGARTAPIFVGGGRAHGPVPHKYTLHMPKTMKHAALKSALSALLRDNQLIFVDDIVVDQPKTKVGKQVVQTLAGGAKSLFVMPSKNETAERAFNNLPNARYLRASYLNVRDLLNFDKVIISLESLQIITDLLTRTPKAKAKATAE